MLSNAWVLLIRRCPLTTRYIYLPLCVLGVLGFIINTPLSFISSNFEVCFPKSNIVFLKTHKCAGSSLQNVLMRYGDVHGLNFVLPKKGNYMGHPAPFNRTMVATPLLPTYNILAHHTRFNYNEIRTLMPTNSVYVTIVRDPVEVFESLYSYFELGSVYGGNLHKFLAMVPKLSDVYVHKRLKTKFGSNQMIFDLGADPSIFTNETLIMEYIYLLDSLFDLVLIADKMDESLVLLKHLMCWDIDDVVTFKLNTRDPRFKSSLNRKEKAVLRELNHADVLLYNHFLREFEKTIDRFGRERMDIEIRQLKKRTQEWYDLCVKATNRLRKPYAKSKYYFNPKVMVFQANTNTNDTCKFMTMEELPYTDILQEKQTSKFDVNYKLRKQRILVKNSRVQNIK